MKILVYGAGPLGSLFAARLQEAGHQVSLLARAAPGRTSGARGRPGKFSEWCPNRFTSPNCGKVRRRG